MVTNLSLTVKGNHLATLHIGIFVCYMVSTDLSSTVMEQIITGMVNGGSTIVGVVIFDNGLLYSDY